MSQDYPNSFVAATEPVQADKLGPAGAEAAKLLAAAGYEVHAGLTTAYVEAIIKMSLEPAIREFCPNDSGSRFANPAAAEEWLSKQRGVFLLLKKDEGLKLAGYGWVGPGTSEHAPGGETTFALRVGRIGQGQGLAAPFSTLMVQGSHALYDAQNLWLETWASNGAAVHVYHKIGFTDVYSKPSERQSPKAGSIADTRLIMTLPNNLLEA